MGELTPRLGLYKADGPEFAEVERDINDNYDKIDLLAAGPYLCTSGTRPVAPYIGQMIYETDTNRVLIFTDDTFWTTISAGPSRRAQRTTDLTAASSLTSTITDGSFANVSSVVCDGVAAFEFAVSWGALTISAPYVSGDQCAIVLQRCAVGNPTVLHTFATSYHAADVANAGASAGGTLITEYVPPAGTWSFHSRFVRTSGSKTFTLQAASAYPARLSLQEIAGTKYNV